MRSDRRERGNITVKEAGRLGGLKTLERHGHEHFVSAGRCGQRVTSDRYTKDDRQKWGALGGRPPRGHYHTMGEEGKFKEGRYGSPPS